MNSKKRFGSVAFGFLFLLILLGMTGFVSADTCTDTDPSVNPFLGGTVTITPDEGPIEEYSDTCGSGNHLSDFYCMPDNTLGAISYECPDGCSTVSGEGRCNPVDCVDSDENLGPISLQIYEKGYTWAENASGTFNDEDYCVGNRVYEQFCNNWGYMWVDSSYTCNGDYICYDGHCMIPAPIVTPQEAINIGETTGTIVVSTDIDADCRYSSTTANFDLMNDFGSTGGTYHTKVLTGLTPETWYNYWVVCSNQGSLSEIAVTPPFQTLSPSSSIWIVNEYVANIAQTSAKLIVYTNIVAGSGCRYHQTATSFYSMAPMDGTGTYFYKELSGLSPETFYDYNIRCRASNGDLTDLGNLEFTTLAEEVENLVVAAQADNILAESARIIADTNAGANCRYHATSTIFNEMISFDSTGGTYHTKFLQALNPSTSYFYYVKCNNATLGDSNLDSVSFTTLDENCGNGIIEPPEQCERDEDCDSGYTCGTDCACHAPAPVCPNGVLEGDEECEDNPLDGCPTGYTCDLNPDSLTRCTCIESGAVCGNGALEGDEECEDSHIYGCDEGYTCDLNPFSRTACQCIEDTGAVCGNDIQEDPEDCDGDDLNGVTCERLGYDGGTLGCIPPAEGFGLQGCVFDVSDCYSNDLNASWWDYYLTKQIDKIEFFDGDIANGEPASAKNTVNVKVEGFPVGTDRTAPVWVEIYEKDLAGDDAIRTGENALYTITDSSDFAVPWTVTQDDIDIAKNGVDVDNFEFYFYIYTKDPSSGADPAFSEKVILDMTMNPSPPLGDVQGEWRDYDLIRTLTELQWQGGSEYVSAYTWNYDPSLAGSTVNVDIYEKDGSDSNYIRTVSGTINSDGEAPVLWTVTQDDIDAADEDCTEISPCEYYFVTNVGADSYDFSDKILNVWEVQDLCAYINICEDYGSNESRCVNDDCNVATDQGTSLGINCSDPDIDCFCEWVPTDNNCVFNSTDTVTVNGENFTVGHCQNSNELISGDCSAGDDFLNYTYNADYIWDSGNIFNSLAECQNNFDPAVPASDCVEDPSGVWHYDSEGYQVDCEADNGETIMMPCPAMIQLPFFNWRNAVAIVLILLLVYLFMGLKRKKANLSKTSSKKPSKKSAKKKTSKKK